MIAIKTETVPSLLKRITEGNVSYPCQFHVQVDWPRIVVYGDRRYYKTSKEGTRTRDGMPSAEYQAEGERRIWLALDDEISED